MLLTIDEAPVHVYTQWLIYAALWLEVFTNSSCLSNDTLRKPSPVHHVSLLWGCDNSIESQVWAFPASFAAYLPLSIETTKNSQHIFSIYQWQHYSYIDITYNTNNCFVLLKLRQPKRCSQPFSCLWGDFFCHKIPTMSWWQKDATSFCTFSQALNPVNVKLHIKVEII